MPLSASIWIIDIRFGSLADLATSPRDVRFTTSWRQSNVRFVPIATLHLRFQNKEAVD
jgi:hypothetical protein